MNKFAARLLWIALLGMQCPAEAKIEHLLPVPKTVTALQEAAFPLVGSVNISDASGNVLLKKFFTDRGMTVTGGAALTVNTVRVDKIDGAYDYVLAGYDNEAYTLEISGNQITITYVDPVGVTRAAQTLGQLAEGYDGNAELEALTLTDWPAFKLRGYTHDVGRSFVTVEALKKHIDLLSRFKVNTFHWHMTENQAWRFEVKAYPQLTESKHMTRFEGSYYTQEQCREVEEYAWERGVTVIPEIDMPGHSAAFQRAMGFGMQTEQGKTVLKKVLDEVVTVFVHAPYIHIGADEEQTTKAYLDEMIGYVRKTLGRKCVVWNPVRGVAVGDTDADMAQLWGTAGVAVAGKANIDCRYNYTNHFDVFADLVGIYKSNIYYKEKGDATVAGTISACWNDRKLATQDDILVQNNFYANVIASASRAWQGGGKRYIDNCTNGGTNGGGGVMLPNSGEEFDDFQNWETRFLFHKAHTLQGEKIPYVRQTNVRWRITDAFPNEGNVAAVFPPEEQKDAEELLPDTYIYKGETYGSGMATGAGIYLRHTWGQGIINAYYANPVYNTTAYAWTYVYSPVEQTVGALIEFQNYSRSEQDPAPASGQWDLMGSKIWINGAEVPAPVYENSGVSISSKEILLKNENFTARRPIAVALKQGWNRVFLKLPYINAAYRLDKWMFTCVFTDAEGEQAVDGLVYSPNKCLNEAAEKVAAKIAELKTYRRSVVSDKPGYYTPETAVELDKIIAEVEATLPEDLPEAERNMQMTKLENALNDFKAACANAQLTQPKVSTAEQSFYYSLSTPLRGNRYATSNGAGADMTGNTTVSAASYWKFVSRADGTLNIVNCSDGTFVSPASNNNTALKTQTASPSAGWTLKAADALGYFIITSGTVEFNQTNNATLGYKVYNWGGGSNISDTGCKYSICEVELEEITVCFVDEAGQAIGAPEKLLLADGQTVTAETFAALVPAGYIVKRFEQSGTTYTVTLFRSSVPEVGGYYYFYNKHKAGDRYFYDNNGTVGFGTAKLSGNEAYIWRCVSNGTDKLDFVNLATGRYFGWKVLTDSPYGWTVDATLGSVGTGGVVNEGCVTLKGVTGSSNYLVIKNGNAFDQSTRAGYYDATFSSDYAFESCGNDVRFLTVDAPAYANARFALGEKVSSNTFLLTDGTEGALRLVSYNSAYKFEGFYDGNTRLETVDASTITESKTITARFSLDVFSENYGDKWIRIQWNRNSSYAMGLAAGSDGAYQGCAGKSVSLDLTSEEQLWCLVGNNTNGFLLYNKTAGPEYALHVSATTDGSPAQLVDAGKARLWKIVQKDATYAVTPLVNTNMSLNSYGGVGMNLKLYNATDGGSLWNFESVTAGMQLASVITGTNPYPTTNYWAGELSFGIDGTTAVSRVSAASAEPVTYYLPIGAEVTLSQNRAYRGFTVGGITINGQTGSEQTFTVSETPLTVTSTFVVDADNEAQYLFYSPSPTNHPYRIPAIAMAKNGDIIALNDHRPCGNDIGFGEVDIYCRVSKDNGRTWSEGKIIADGTGIGGTVDCGFGDAALCADRERNELLMMAVCGNAFYGSGSTTRSNPNRMARFTAKLNEATGEWEWSTFNKATDELTEQVYGLFDDGDVNGDGTPDPIQALFIGSGRLYQSKYVKVGDYYRIYAALCARPNGNRVIYSDDFGKTWKPLGGNTALPAPAGDEPKCEELPDGSVLLSSRAYGRIFNIYKFTNPATGAGRWLGAVKSDGNNKGIAVGNSTNGDVMLLNAIRKNDGAKVKLLLQSVPFGNGRSDVGFFYKELTEDMYEDVSALAANWTKGLQVTDQPSAYSAFTLQGDKRIGFFLEDGPATSNGYSMVYIPLTLEEITKGTYELDENPLITGVGAAKAPVEKDGSIYSLSGYKVEAPEKGVYIINGRKVLVK